MTTPVLGKLGLKLQNQLPLSSSRISAQTEATISLATSVDFEWTARRYIPELRRFYTHRCEDFKPQIENFSSKLNSMIP
jgi:hypothetical protein